MFARRIVSGLPSRLHSTLWGDLFPMEEKKSVLKRTLTHSLTHSHTFWTGTRNLGLRIGSKGVCLEDQPHKVFLSCYSIIHHGQSEESMKKEREREGEGRFWKRDASKYHQTDCDRCPAKRVNDESGVGGAPKFSNTRVDTKPTHWIVIKSHDYYTYNIWSNQTRHSNKSDLVTCLMNMLLCVILRFPSYQPVLIARLGLWTTRNHALSSVKRPSKLPKA